MYRFGKENELLFVALASILNTKGADIKMQMDFSGDEVKHTNIPYIGSGHYMGDEGFYFKAQRDFFGIPLDQIRDSFPYNIDGYKFECVSISEFEMDDDRTWSESVGFIVTKDGKNVLK
jgi:hypothetical protein|tara:strand:+ start:1326 stop:1682 length:357 start_codon:yes stop_codon:yes gene_type:complete